MANVENLKIIRFLTGEEIMAEVLEETKEVLVVKNAVRIVVVPSQTDTKNPSVGFAPYSQWTDEKELTLNRSHVTLLIAPITEFVNQYNGMFGGLVVPNSKIITP
jgi:hypothetical protein